MTEVPAAHPGDRVHRGLMRFPAELRGPLCFATLHIFSGQAVIRPVYAPPGLDEAVLRVVTDMLLAYAASLEARRAE